MEEVEMEAGAVHAKIAEYESFVERVLKADHERCLEDIRDATATLEECRALARNIGLLLKEDIAELETSVELGCQFYVKAFVPDTSTIFIDIGLNFRLEMPLADAQSFLKDKELHLLKGLDLKNKRVAKVKADIHEALHLIDLMTQIQNGQKHGLRDDGSRGVNKTTLNKE
eukprot:Skav200606  [mRNA]  locus=scaffold879:94000:106888:- [translate_table: standard]